MAIYAKKIGSERSSSGLSLKLSDNIPDGSILVYDAEKQAFVNQMSTGLLPVTGAINLGGNNAIGVFAENYAGILQFKQIVAGSGVLVTTNETSITISSNISESNLSVSGGYNITIDNQNTAPNSLFEISTIVSSEPIKINPITTIPIVSDNVYSGNDNSGQGYFLIPQYIDLAGFGVQVGQWIVIGNAGDQTGTWQIQKIVDYTTNNVVYSQLIVQEFVGNFGLNLGGPKPQVSLLPVDLYISDKFTISSFSLDFSKGFAVGSVFTLSGTQNGNDGSYTVIAVHPKGTTPFDQSYLTLSQNTPFSSAGPLIGTITITVTEVRVPTGFSVGTTGQLTATTITANGVISDHMEVGLPIVGSYSLVKPNDVVRNDNLNELRNLTSKARSYFMSMLG